jgi:membrane-associated PAP2 superfamily phosphatase
VAGQRRTVVWYGESDAHGTSSAKRLTIPAAAAVALLLMSGFSRPGDAQCLALSAVIFMLGLAASAMTVS